MATVTYRMIKEFDPTAEMISVYLKRLQLYFEVFLLERRQCIKFYAVAGVWHVSCIPGVAEGGVPTKYCSSHPTSAL